MNYSCVVFDLDGTLLNTIDDLADAANCVCSGHGWPVFSADQYKDMVGRGIPVLVSRFSPPGLSESELAAAVDEFCAAYAVRKANKTAPYPQIPSVLAALKAAGVSMAVLSNKADTFAKAVVEQYLPGIFDGVQGAVDGQPLKPDPALLRRLLNAVQADPARTLFVGDSDVDICTGKNASLVTCGVLWGFRGRDELAAAGADILVLRPEELVRLVLGTELIAAGEADRAVRMLERGDCVALPTETVYGLAADAFRKEAVEAVYEAKGRPEEKPLSVLVDGMAMAETVCQDIPPDAYKLADAFWPGPLTMILKSSAALPSLVTAGGDTQGVRCPSHPDTLAVIRALGRPLACPSANLSGRESPRCAGDVFAQLSGKIAGVLDGGPCSVGVESTILDMTARPYRILRQGGLGADALERVLGERLEGGGIC